MCIHPDSKLEITGKSIFFKDETWRTPNSGNNEKADVTTSSHPFPCPLPLNDWIIFYVSHADTGRND
jgi:hypothetical protein